MTSIGSILRVAILAIFTSFGSHASAGLVGQNIAICADSVRNVGSVTTDTSVCGNGAQPSPNSAIVSNIGVEFSLSGRQIDLTDNTVTLTYSNSGSPSPDLFIFSNILDFITGLTLLTADPLDVTTAFDSHVFALQVNSPLENGTVTFRIETGASVPEPGTLALLGLSVLGLGISRRRVAR